MVSHERVSLLPPSSCVDVQEHYLCSPPKELPAFQLHLSVGPAGGGFALQPWLLCDAYHFFWLHHMTFAYFVLMLVISFLSCL